MDNAELRAVAGRIDRLEAENRRLRRLILLTLVSITLPLLAVQCSSGRTIKAEQLVIEDGQGKPRASLGLDGEGTRLRLYDAQGKRRASLSLGADGQPGLALFDAEGRAGAVLEITKSGAALSMSDASGKTIFSKP